MTDRPQASSAHLFPVSRWNEEMRERPSASLHQAGREAFGDDYPEEAEPHSFVTRTDLARMARLVAVGPGQTLVDLGCGRGGPGLWLASATGADYIGVDISPNPLELARQRASELGLAARSRFVLADLCATGLPDRSCDGAVSIEVMMLLPDKDAGIREAARVLRPGARLVFTAFEPRDSGQFSGLLRASGFEVEMDEDKPDWERRNIAFYQGIIARQSAIIAEMGEGARWFINEAEFAVDRGTAGRRHAFFVGRRL
jgi:ubiquinone/menaquinone biosynthesis C-methylase UbiE